MLIFTDNPFIEEQTQETYEKRKNHTTKTDTNRILFILINVITKETLEWRVKDCVIQKESHVLQGTMRHLICFR